MHPLSSTTFLFIYLFLFFLQATLDDMEDELLVGSNHILPDHFSQSRDFDLLQVK